VGKIVIIDSPDLERFPTSSYHHMRSKESYIVDCRGESLRYISSSLMTWLLPMMKFGTFWRDMRKRISNPKRKTISRPKNGVTISLPIISLTVVMPQSYETLGVQRVIMFVIVNKSGDRASEEQLVLDRDLIRLET
jgi:hypothetical protein